MSRAQHAAQAAADWIIRREDGQWSDADQADFDAWLSASDGNRAAYWRLKHSWRQADRIGALGQEAPIAPVDRTAMMRWWKPLAAAASIVAIVGTATIATGPWRNPPTQVAQSTYGTATGGHRRVGLTDGSTVELNTRTRLRTALTRDRREVWLDQGEAYFEVAHIADRPFVVHAGSRTVTVLGTKFSVRRDGEKVTVSVVEGRVRVADVDQASVPAAVISAGDVAIAQGPSTLFTEKSEQRVAGALAWRSGTLTFDKSPLSDVAAEFNRYNRKAIIVKDPETAAIRIGGSFPAEKPEIFVRLLRDAYGLTVETTDDTMIVSN